MDQTYKIGQMTRILGDDDKFTLGRVIGTATVVVDEFDTSHHGSDVGKIGLRYIVRPELDSQGWIGREDDDGIFEKVDPPMYVTELVVHPDNIEAAPFYVNVYRHDSIYAGPEEGGRFYDAFTPVVTESYVFVGEWAKQDAEVKKEKLLEVFPRRARGRARRGYYDTDWVVLIEHREPVASNTYAPYC